MSKGNCQAAEGCDRREDYRGYCNMHYKRLRKAGQLSTVRHRQIGACAVDGCNEPAQRRGWCAIHSARFYRNGTTEVLPRSSPGTCSVDDCDGVTVARGYCRKHYCRWQRHGRVDYLVRAPAGTGCITEGGYRVVPRPGHPLANPRSGVVFEHRAVLYDAIGAGPHPCHWCGVVLGWRAGLTVDHLDWNRLNNVDMNLVPSCRPCNSRRITTKETA